jgi:anti-sigma regulatory factor (Ser/Thr protein kinase)
LEADPGLVRAARQFVRARLRGWERGDDADEAVLVASELVTNAVLHARTLIRLTVVVNEARVRIEVFDENTRMPVIAAIDSDATSGRGLALVAATADSWGIEQRDDGKVVWAEIGHAGPAQEQDCVDLTQIDTIDHALREIQLTCNGAGRPRVEEGD